TTRESLERPDKHLQKISRVLEIVREFPPGTVVPTEKHALWRKQSLESRPTFGTTVAKEVSGRKSKMITQTKAVSPKAKAKKRWPIESTPEGVDVLLDSDAPCLICFTGSGPHITKRMDHPRSGCWRS